MTNDTPTLFFPQNAEVCANLSADQERLVREIISRVADKWSLWALSELAKDGPLRFSRLLERVIGVSQKSLTATLRNLERDGLVTRTVMVNSPIRVDYAATAIGIDLVRQVDPLWTWVARNNGAFTEARIAFEANRSVQTSNAHLRSSTGTRRCERR